MQSGILAWVTILRKKHYGSLHYFVFCLVYDWFKQLGFDQHLGVSHGKTRAFSPELGILDPRVLVL